MYRFILPLMYSSVSTARIFGLFLLADAVSSYWLALLFQANHVVTDVEWPLPDENKLVNMDWAELQVVTAQDYAHGSSFWTNLSGSLNYQVVHHLFPQISQHYYPEIAPLVLESCEKFGIKYRVKKTYWEAIAAHLEHLKVLGKEGLKRKDSKVE
jgi:fatty acid desaturase